ncbi:GH25 family lysozyme [Liquorilactobacillus hordei]|uniref:Lysozyme n=1 Tax=Liquorilactobacillus hordei TaxID=468911 RepID=A0A3Q8CYC3_9LACO|nr:GH25 family lysozyme [Liquorilactobacillus hordei]AUJ29432.1 hypothetical protein BSQ49_03990 [Liquorilactobacillus hordei]
MQGNRKKKLIKQYKKSNLKRQLTLVSGLTMLSLGTGISLSTYIAQADDTTSAVSISQSSSSSSSTTSATSQSSSSNSSISTNSETTSVNSTEKTSSINSDSPSSSSANAVSETQSTDSSITSNADSKAEQDTVISSSSSASTSTDSSNIASTSSTNNVSTTSDNTTMNSSSSSTDASISTTTEVSTTLDTTTTTPVAFSAAVTSLLSVRVPDNISIGDSNYTHADAIDISSYQNWITLNDFLQLKSLGIKSVIVKITEGTTYKNPYAASQISLAEQAGLNVAVYHYATFSDSSSGSAQGQHVAQTMQNLGLDKNVLIFADMEDKTTLSDSIQPALYAFWNSLTAAGFNNHGVYTYISYAYRDQVVATVGKARTWIAQYPYTPSNGGYYENEWKNEGYGGWQFSSTAYIDGHTLDISHDYNGLLTNISNLNDNLANIDSISVSGNKVSISGWHISPKSTIEQNAYIIMFDSTTGKEIERVKYTPLQRTDVADAYWYIPNSAKSGFAVTFTLPSGYKFGGKNIQFVLRYSDDPNGNGNTTDIWSQKYNYTDNIGNVDKLYLNTNNVLSVTGWHAADASTTLKNAFLIVFDNTTGKELTRVAYTPTTRSDVANSNYGYILNAGQSGFSQNINLSKYLVNGHQIQIVMRYSAAANGEGNHVDYWSNLYTIANANAANLDSFSLSSNNTLHVAGWHAADASTELKNAFLIVFDATTGKEIKRVAYNPISRPDVAKNGYANIYNAAQSGFSQDIDLGSTLVNGHQLQIVMRYSDAVNGGGNHIDYLSKTYAIPNANAANLDNFSLSSNNVLHVAGWHAADASTALKNAFLIVFDATTGKEIKRVAYNPISRPDVAKNGYANVYNAAQSGFSQDIDLGSTFVNGHQLQIVMRYSDAANGEGNHVDYWSDKHYIANNNSGHLDSFSSTPNGVLRVAGWHAADASTALKNAFLIVFDATTGKEIKRVAYNPISRPDVVKNGYANVYNAAQSGFVKDIPLSSTTLRQLKGHTIQIVMRYSSDATTGEGTRIDYWSDKRIL